MADSQPHIDGEILQMWRKDGRLYGITGLLVGLALGVIILPAIGSLENAADMQAFLNDLAPELIGILITVAFIDRLNRRRDERNAEEALKQQLVMDAGSQSNEKAKDAVHQLRKRGWLTGEDGLLRGANLSIAALQNAVLYVANLQSAYLRWANLQGADLHSAQLQGANLSGSYLQGANFNGAKLQRVSLSGAELQGANLSRTSLQGANLSWANLTGAKLFQANLQGAELLETKFDSKTNLPNGIDWTPEIDMRRFTDPNHPDFWQPGWDEDTEE